MYLSLGLDFLTVYAGTELRAETPDDPPRAPGYLRRVGTQGVRDRVVRLTVEQHREHREVVVVELRDRCLKYVVRDRWHHDFSVGDPADRSEQRMDGLGLVDDAVGLGGTRRDGQGGTRIRRIDDHGRGVWAALDAVALRHPSVRARS